MPKGKKDLVETGVCDSDEGAAAELVFADRAKHRCPRWDGSKPVKVDLRKAMQTLTGLAKTRRWNKRWYLEDIRAEALEDDPSYLKAYVQSGRDSEDIYMDLDGKLLDVERHEFEDYDQAYEWLETQREAYR